MNKTASTLLKFIAGAAVVLVVIIIGSALMMSYLFRERTEPPIQDAEVRIRLANRQPQFTSAELDALDIDSYSKNISWDGTTHETWIGLFPPGMEHKLRLKDLLEIQNPDEAWGFPEVSIAKGRKVTRNMLWTSGGDIVVWPVENGFLVKYSHTEIRNK